MMNVKSIVEENFKLVFRIEIATLLGSDGTLDLKKMERLVMICTNLLNSGVQVAVVSSGAIVLGSARLGIAQTPDTFIGQQAAAAVGMAELITQYQLCFDAFNQIAAQVLLTKDVMEDEAWSRNASNTFNKLFEMNIVPVVNENDSVSTEDIELGDNYPLALDVARLTGAQLIIIRQPVEGNYLLVTRLGKWIPVNEEGLFSEVEKFRKEQRDFASDSGFFPEQIPNQYLA
jgi:glutamate 5-kinase